MPQVQRAAVSLIAELQAGQPTCLTIGLFSNIRQQVPRTEERISPLRQRMIEDMPIRGMGDT